MGTRSAAAQGGDQRAAADPVVELRDVRHSYGPTAVLFGVDLVVGRGEVVGLLGTNGAGKSTLLRVLSGLDRPTSGTVLLGGRDVTALPAEQRCRLGLALVVGGRGVFPDLTVRENLELGGYLVRSGLDARIDRELARFPQLARRVTSTAGSLSGGEQQQLALAKALLVDPDVLCIDELSLGLSPGVVAELFAVVRAATAEGVSLVVVEQSLNLAAELCDRAVFLEKGRVRFEGHPRELLERGDLARSVFLGRDPMAADEAP